MFKKIRNKFVMLNIISVLIVLLVAFSSIFLITYQNVEKEINIKLERALNEKDIFPRDDIKREPNLYTKDPFSAPTASFCLLLDEDNELLGIYNTFFTLSSETVSPLLEQVLQKDKEKSFFTYDGQYWAYQLVSNPHGQLLAFVNITDNANVLLNFIYAFILVTVMVSIIIVIWGFIYANRAISPIKEAFHQQEEFISNASHELKTPLTIINTTLNVIRSNQEEPVKKQEKWLGYIQNETNRMSTLTNDLLFLTRMEKTDTSIFSSFDISQALETSILSMEAVAFEQGVILTFDGSSITYYGHLESIKRLFYILIDNAIKYNIKNGYVNAHINKLHKQIVITIKNSSLGMEEKHTIRVFDRFYRVEDSRNRETGGYGIGLSIAKSIVDKHQGAISVNSILNDSTTFTITLPITEIKKEKHS